MESITIPFIGTTTSSAYGSSTFPSLFGGVNQVPNSLKMVTITGGTTIHENAFKDCKSLEVINLPNTTTTIKNNAFYNCTSLKSIVIPDSVTSIGKNVLFNCKSLESITIPTVCSFLGYWFGGTYYYDNDKYVPTSLKTIILSNACTRIPDNAFYGLAGITVVAMGVNTMGEMSFNLANKSTLSIGDNFQSFTGRINLQEYDSISINYYGSTRNWLSITGKNYLSTSQYCHVHLFLDGSSTETKEVPSLPSDISTIGDYAFCCCDNITTVNIPNSITSIGEAAFINCKSITSVNIPKTVTSIGKRAFANCYYITSITIPFIGTSVDSNNKLESVFYTSRLESVNLLETCTIIPDYGFSNCDVLQSLTIPNSVTSIGNYAFKNCKCLKTLTIPNNVTSIGYNAFESCTALKTINISKSVLSIGSDAFTGCSALETINVDESNEYFASINGTLYNKGITELIKCPCKTTGAFNIPSGVTSIGRSAFDNCAELLEITIPNSVTSISIAAFKSCTALKTMVVPNGVTTIGYCAFYNCSSLESITLPFVGDGLSPSNYKNFSFLFGAYDYFDTDKYVPKSLKTVILTSPCTAIATKAFYNCNSIELLVLPNTITTIGENAFTGCDSLQYVCFEGTRTQYLSKEISTFSLTIVYFYSESQPSGSENYWHYVNGQPTIW